MTFADSWPVMLTASGVLVAWGDLRARVSGMRKDVDTKVSQGEFAQLDKRLDNIEAMLLKLINGKAA